jgi:hypothetical protein
VAVLEADVPEAAVEGWRNSPGHYRNMLLPDFNVCGIGVAVYFKKSSKDSADDQGRWGSFEGQPPEERETVTFVTMLFGIEREEIDHGLGGGGFSVTGLPGAVTGLVMNKGHTNHIDHSR